MIITRKIQVYVNTNDKDKKKAYYDILFERAYICRKAANILSSHLYTQDNIVDYVYLTEEIKLKLADINKDEKGIFKTSSQNTGYRLLSSLYKGKISMDIMSMLNNNIYGLYKSEKNEYYKGLKSLRNYKSNIPIPIASRMFLKSIDSDYTFDFYGIPMKIYFGRDLSQNKLIVDRAISEEYKMSNSSIYYDKKNNKWFLLFCVNIPKQFVKLKDKNLYAFLSTTIPIIAITGEITEKSFSYEIGCKEEYLYQRIRIQTTMKNLQKSLKYTAGGRGRQKKLQAIERFKKIESNYIKTKLHQYSKELINTALKNKTNTIVLVTNENYVDEIKQEPFLLRNWNYYQLNELIKYKANRYNITIKKENLNQPDYEKFRTKTSSDNQRLVQTN